MTEALYLIILLVELYMAVGVMLIGFGFMVAGKIGSSRVASFYFGMSLRWMVQRVTALLAWMLTGVVLFLEVWIIRRLASRLWRGMRWLTGTRRRMTVTVGVLVLGAVTLVAFATPAPAGAQTVTVRARGHMFFVDMVLNDRAKVRGIIDTGATFLSMCASTTKTLGLVLTDHVRLKTANGVIINRKATVQSVRIGSLEVRNVVAVVDERPSCDKEVLVGMSVLRQLHMTVDQERLTLRARSSEAALQPNDGVRWLLGGLCSVLLVLLIIVRRMRASLGQRRPWAHQTTAGAPLRFRSFFD
jgi:clan AA aspartic protease (TIGR02281 family)